MAVTGARLRYRQFNGIFRNFIGVNYVDHPATIPEGYLVRAENVIISTMGTIKKRPYFAPYGYMPGSLPQNTSFRVIGQYSTSTGINQVIAISISTSNMYYSTNNGNTYTAVSPLPNPVMGVQYLDTFYIITQANGVYKWNGTTLSAIAGSPNGFWISVFKDRLWVCGTDSQLFYSSVGPAQETWPGANVLKINGGDGQRLVAAIPFADHIVCFKTGSMWNLYLAPDPSAWQVRVFQPTRGCLSPYAVKLLNGQIYWIDYEGVFKTDGSQITLLSDPIRNLFQRRPYSGSFYYQDNLSFFDKYMFCAFLTQTGSSNVNWRYMVYNSTSNGWTEWLWTSDQGAWQTQFNPTEIFRIWPQLGGQAIYLVSQDQAPELGPNAPVLYSLSDPNSVGPRWDGQSLYPVVSTVRTRRTDFNFQYRTKRNFVSFVEIGTADPGTGGKGGELNMSYYIENKGVQLETIPHLVNLVPTEASYRVPGAGYFREISTELSEATNAYWEIQALWLPFTIKSDQAEGIQ